MRFGEFLTPVLTFANAALGAGVLAYPFAYEGTGLAIGPILTTGIALLAFSSLVVIMRVAAEVQATQPHVQSYGGIVTAVVGLSVVGPPCTVHHHRLHDRRRFHGHLLPCAEASWHSGVEDSAIGCLRGERLELR